MRLYAFHAGDERSDMAQLIPFDPDVGKKVEIPYSFFLIEHPEGYVLFDSGAHRDFISNPQSRIGDAANEWEVILKDGDDVVSKLATVGVSPNDVRHVALSHLHFDHAGGIEFFPEAEFHIQRAELPFAYWPPIYQRAIYVRADFDHPVTWNELSGERDLFGDDRIVLFPTPGHTPGHQSMVVKLDSEPLILVGDAAYLPKSIAERQLPAVVWNPDAMVASWEHIEAMQRRYGAALIFSHDLDFDETVKLAPGEWYE